MNKPALTVSTLPKLVLIASLLSVTACTTIPSGPSMMALPGTGKSFEQFRADDGYCRQYGLQQSNGKTTNQAANESFAKSAVVGTAVGAVVGAAMGGGQGAAVGAGSGLLVGSAIGADAAQESSYTVQQRYDHAYIQCMYSMGHRVPVTGNFVPQATPLSPAKSAPRNLPPPPPGYSPATPPPPPPN